MKYRIGSKAGNLARVLAVVAIVLMSALTALVSLGGVALADAPVYAPSQSVFIYGGSEYSPMFYRADLGYYYLAGMNAWDMSGENDIDCGLYYVPVMDENLSILYEHGQKAVIDGRFGSPIDYSESLFVTTDGVYAYQGNPAGWTILEETVDPPTLDIYIPLPVSGNRSVFKTPETNFSDTDTLYVYSSVGIIEEDTCLAWEDEWGQGYLYPPMPLMVGNQIGEGGMGSVIARGLLAYNTSSIPDDAVITGAYLRIMAYAVWSDFVEDYTFVVGGTYNASLTPWYLGEGEPETVYYSESEFYGDFGEVNVSDFPAPGFSYGFDVSADATFNNDGLDYIDAGGYTVLSLRAESDIDHICPLPNGSVFAGIWGVNDIQDGISSQPATLLVVDWYIPEEGGAGLVSPQIAVMMDIIAILFLTGFIIGLLFVIAKSEGMPLATKAGAITTIAVMAVVGVIIIESLVVAFK
jgi:hypothetical protein